MSYVFSIATEKFLQRWMSFDYVPHGGYAHCSVVAGVAWCFYCFPKSLKRAKILPIFKNKDKFDVTNYRPISILPVISKVYEKVLYNRL